MHAIRKRPNPYTSQQRTAEKTKVRNAVKKEDRNTLDGIIAQHTYQQSYFATTDALIYSCRYGKLELLNYLADKIDPVRHWSNMTKIAATHGHLHVLKWIKTWLDQKYTAFQTNGIRILPHYRWHYYETGIGNAALEKDHIHILDWIWEESTSHNRKTPSPSNESVIVMGTFSVNNFNIAGSHRTLQWLTDRGWNIADCSPRDIKRIIQKALKLKKLGMMWWLRRNHVMLGKQGNMYCFLYDQLLDPLRDEVGNDLFGLICKYV